MKIAGIIGGALTAILGLFIILFPTLLSWIVGIALIITGIVYALQWIKK